MIDLNGLTRIELKKVINYYNINNDIKNFKNKTLQELRDEIYNHIEMTSSNKIGIKARDTEWSLDQMKQYKKVLKIKQDELLDNKKEQVELKNEEIAIKEEIAQVKDIIEGGGAFTKRYRR